MKAPYSAKKIGFIGIMCDNNLEERIGRCLPISVDGLGQLLETPLDVESECLLNHPVHLVSIVEEPSLDLKR